jgi:hypothetical protein
VGAPERSISASRIRDGARSGYDAAMRMRIHAAVLAAAGCSSSTSPPPEHPAPAAVTADAAVPDADVPDEVASAPAWIFRFNGPGRLETWTLRTRGAAALVVVQAAQRTTRYTGAAADGASLVLTLASGPNKLSLDCKRDKLAVSATCGDRNARPIDVLNCYHPDFQAPMSFGPAPGIEYMVSDACSGYRLLE